MDLMRITISFGLIFLCTLISQGFCGDVTVSFSPSNLRFGSASSLKSSDLDDVVAASLGYTPQPVHWKGLTVVAPFNYPSAVVFIGIHGGGATVRQEGTTYGLKEDVSFGDIYGSLQSSISRQSLRAVHFRHISVSSRESDHNILAHTTKLNNSIEPDATFLKEIGALLHLAETVNNGSKASDRGQDIVFLELDSLAMVVKTYGLDSAQVKEATGIVRDQLSHVADIVRRIYNNEVIVMTALLDHDENSLIRKTRAASVAAPVSDNNLATVYTEDYPVIFNIILWFAIIFFLSVLAVSVAMATMDPGRDSIIYRMTNPRMKKDQ